MNDFGGDFKVQSSLRFGSEPMRADRSMGILSQFRVSLRSSGELHRLLRALS